jgi:hypothetical protein
LKFLARVDITERAASRALAALLRLNPDVSVDLSVSDRGRFDRGRNRRGQSVLTGCSIPGSWRDRIETFAA